MIGEVFVVAAGTLTWVFCLPDERKLGEIPITYFMNFRLRFILWWILLFEFVGHSSNVELSIFNRRYFRRNDAYSWDVEIEVGIQRNYERSSISIFRRNYRREKMCNSLATLATFLWKWRINYSRRSLYTWNPRRGLERQMRILWLSNGFYYPHDIFIWPLIYKNLLTLSSRFSTQSFRYTCLHYQNLSSLTLITRQTRLIIY